MKHFIFLACLLSLISPSCKQTEYQPTGEISAPSQEQVDSVKVVQNEIKEEAEKTAPSELVDKKQKRREEKEDDSPFRKVGCCKTDAPPALCCCDAIFISYQEMLHGGKVNTDLRASDPLFNDCYKLIPDFKKKVDEMEMSDEEE